MVDTRFSAMFLIFEPSSNSVILMGINKIPVIKIQKIKI